MIIDTDKEKNQKESGVILTISPDSQRNLI